MGFQSCGVILPVQYAGRFPNLDIHFFVLIAQKSDTYVGSPTVHNISPVFPVVQVYIDVAHTYKHFQNHYWDYWDTSSK